MRSYPGFIQCGGCRICGKGCIIKKNEHRCKDCLRERNKKWRKKNPDKVAEMRKRRIKVCATTIRGYLSRTLGSCVCRSKGKHETNLTLDYLQEIWDNQNGICPISGIEMSIKSGRGHGNAWMYTPSIDRINPKLGYTKGNVRLVCNWVNIMKFQYSDEQLIEMCRKIVNYHESKIIQSDKGLINEEPQPIRPW